MSHPCLPVADKFGTLWSSFDITSNCVSFVNVQGFGLDEQTPQVSQYKGSQCGLQKHKHAVVGCISYVHGNHVSAI